MCTLSVDSLSKTGHKHITFLDSFISTNVFERIFILNQLVSDDCWKLQQEVMQEKVEN